MNADVTEAPPPPVSAPGPSAPGPLGPGLRPGVAALLSAVGYDPAIVVLLPRGEARFFVAASIWSVVASFIAGCSLGYGALLAVGWPAAVVLAPATSLFVINLLRLHHAGSGYPLHLPLELIGAWRPAGAAVVVLFTLGLLITQPLVLLVQKPLLDRDIAARVADERALRGLAQPDNGGTDEHAVTVVDGLIVRGRLAWDRHPLSSSLLSLLFAGVVAGPAFLRRSRPGVLRRYESERWIIERMFVDDEWAVSQDAITALLAPLPGFSGALSAHYGDPPYNTRPLVFGLDPDIVVSGRVKFVRNRHGEQPAPALPETAAPTSSPPVTLPSSLSPPASIPSVRPASRATSVGQLPAVPLRPGEVEDRPVPQPPSTTNATNTTNTNTTPPSPSGPGAGDPGPTGPVVLLSIVDVARESAAAARERVPAAFIARYLGRSVDDVTATLAAADDALPLHKVFPEWNKLPTLLLQDAGFALDHGMARVLAIVVERDVDQVSRRLRAAPRDKRLSGVFAPELARRLLNKTI